MSPQIWLLLGALVPDLARMTRAEALIKRGADGGADGGAPRDALALTMHKLYEHFSKKRQPQSDRNTVRSFRARPVSSNKTTLFYFNLTSIPESELILSASLHFLHHRGQKQRWNCQHSRGASCRIHNLEPPPPVRLVLRAMSQITSTPTQLGNITLSSYKKGLWQMSDVSSVLKLAHARSEPLIYVEFVSAQRHGWWQDHLSPHTMPHILVYANDLAIHEPNSIGMSLQRYSPVRKEREARSPSFASSLRNKREAEQDGFTNENQINDLKNMELWYNTYYSVKPLSKRRDQKGPDARIGAGGSQELSFDEKTMKKARRKQWTEPRMCTRRYLRVDFADIGWSEWILAPKAFDAYYCAGMCGFPLPKVVHPSNHATIQSIVRAVGIVPGVPEPCCVPEKMNMLPVLFMDTTKNMVLKMYPNMSVETCACR